MTYLNSALIFLSAFLLIQCDVTSTGDTTEDRDDEQEEEQVTRTVSDIDGNEYRTIIIGEMEWMAHNLRTTSYTNGNSIPTGLSNDDWATTRDGAYAIYDHEAENTAGIDSPEEMIEIFGLLYNRYAIEQDNICPSGWSVPSRDDWQELIDYLIDQHGYSNERDDPKSVGQALKVARQIRHPYGGPYDTDEHPRWELNSDHYGLDPFGFSGLPAGLRSQTGNYGSIGTHAFWWSLTDEELSPMSSPFTTMTSTHNYMGYNAVINDRSGLSVRCVREAPREEPDEDNGDHDDDNGDQDDGDDNGDHDDDNGDQDDEDEHITDRDGNQYKTVIIDNQEWMAENLRVTRYANGDEIATDLNTDQWPFTRVTEQGAFSIYPHTGGPRDGDIEGIDSDEAMAEAYGLLYNWYAVTDPRGLCPEGWHVPGEQEWLRLIEYVESQGFPNESRNTDGAGNALKSCRQAGSPLGDNCDTGQHPRWNEIDPLMGGNHYGTDHFGFSALPAGGRSGNTGGYFEIGAQARFWSADENNELMAHAFYLAQASGHVPGIPMEKPNGMSVRCVREE
ncbi:fibrobacter succinogenes major paralogous domain-containing protein [Balneolales bacterium ANBcel1]|nr:fibrobacter succinogenes major paralogous domain-containing protein [Balneolales bacterium ANBcel1]